MNQWIIRLCFCLFLVSGLASAADCDNPKPLRIAQVPQINRDMMLAQYQPLYQHLEMLLKRKVEVVQASSYTAVVEGLIDGTVDVAELGPAAYAQAKKRGADIVAFAAFSGQRGTLFDLSKGYRAILVARSERNIDKLEKLKGATISLVDPASTSGALYQRFMIQQQTGMPLERYFGRISFAGSHDRALEAVKLGLTDAAFIANTKFDTAVTSGKLAPNELSIVWQSELIPMDPFVYRKKLCRSVIEPVVSAFLGDQMPLRPMLEMMKRPDGFMAVSDENYKKIRELYDAVP